MNTSDQFNDIAVLFTILFVLSMISERFTEWMKNFLCGRKIPVINIELIGDTLTKYPKGSKQETRRQYRVLKLNIFGGFLTSIACHASFFDLISSPSSLRLGWDEPTKNWFLFFGGCIITGLFISVGSKFWHDLLDLVLAIKNVKRTIINEAGKNELVVKPYADQQSIIQAAITENVANWRNTIKNFQGVTITNKLTGDSGYNTGRLCIQFNVSRKETVTGGSGRVPEFVYYGGVQIPTDVKETGVVNALGFTGEGMSPKLGGSSISRDGKPDDTGTLGIRVKIDNEWHGISCYHVLFSEELRGGIKSVEQGDTVHNASVVSPSAQDAGSWKNIGKASFGKLSKYVDVGFFKTSAGDVSPEIHGFKIKQSIHDFNPETENNKLKVKFCGRTSGVVTEGGYVTGISPEKDITYFRNNSPFRYTMNNLIEMKMPAQGGDSGSIVVTEDGALLGMIVAAGDGYSYAVSIRSIFNNYPFEF